jgi:hypothetical protein
LFSPSDSHSLKMSYKLSSFLYTRIPSWPKFESILLSSKKDIDDHIFSGQFQVNFQVISVTPIISVSDPSMSIYFTNIFFFFKYCVLVEISWPEGLRIARLHDLKMEIQTYNRLYFYFITEQNFITKLTLLDITVHHNIFEALLKNSFEQKRKIRRKIVNKNKTYFCFLFRFMSQVNFWSGKSGLLRSRFIYFLKELQICYDVQLCLIKLICFFVVYLVIT